MRLNNDEAAWPTGDASGGCEPRSAHQGPEISKLRRGRRRMLRNVGVEVNVSYSSST